MGNTIQYGASCEQPGAATLARMSWPVKFLACFCAAGAVDAATMAFGLSRYVTALSESRLATLPRSGILVLFTALLVLSVPLLAHAAWSLTRSGSRQKIVSQWSVTSIVAWTFLLAATLFINYPVPAQAHHLDKFLLGMVLGMGWTLWLAVHPESLAAALQSRPFRAVEIAAINLAVFLLVGEAAVRGLDPVLSRSGLFGDKHTPANLKPHFPVTGSIGFTNSQGFRDREHTMARSGAGPRILALGDSFTWGAGVSYDDVFVTRLERRLKAAWKEAEIINLGVPAWGPHEEFHLLKTYGIRFKPDLVMLNFFVGNDIQNKRGDDIHLPRLLVIAGQSYYVHSNGNWLHDTFAADRWYLYHNLNYLLKVGGAAWNRRFGDEAVSSAADDQPPLVSHDYYLRGIRERSDIYLVEETPFFRHHWARTRETILAMREFLARQGIPLLLVAIPEHLQLDRTLQREYLATVSEAAARYDFGKPQRLLVSWSREQGIPVVDLQPVFERAGSPEQLYFRNDFHWTAQGHQLAAEAIFHLLQRELEQAREEGQG